MKFLFGLILVLIFLFFGLGPKLVEKRINQVSEHNPYSISDEASNLHADLFIGDWHAAVSYTHLTLPTTPYV